MSSYAIHVYLSGAYFNFAMHCDDKKLAPAEVVCMVIFVNASVDVSQVPMGHFD